MSTGEEVHAASRRFFVALEYADRAAALSVVDDLLIGGVDPVTVLQDVVCAAQLEVGRRWQTADWTVAREHAATAISEAAVTAAVLRSSPDPADAARRQRHVIVACVDEEWHALPARVVAEVLALRGWRSTYLGASTPPEQLAAYLQEVVPDVVALSCSLATGLPRVRRMIEAVHTFGIPVVVGGPAFGADGRLAGRLGADAWAPTAEAAVPILDALPLPLEQLVPLDHPGMDEYADLAVRRPGLVHTAYARLEERFPPLRAYSPFQVARTKEDLGHIVDFLAATLFVDDPEIFRKFTDWLQEVLVSRGVDERALRLSYQAVIDVLGGTPIARRVLEDATARLPG